MRPAVSLPEDSGPARAAEVSTPRTLNEFVLIDDVCVPPRRRLPGDGIVPVTVRSVRASAPAAPETSGSAEMRLTEDEPSVPRPLAEEISRFRSKCVPAAGVLLKLLVISCRIWNPAGAPLPLAAALVTVMSVPTPYRACSTVPWASWMPDDAAVTVMTRPTPTARPRLMRTAWRSRRRSSRRR